LRNGLAKAPSQFTYNEQGPVRIIGNGALPVVPSWLDEAELVR